MVRNLKHGNSRPCRPTRVWAKITPPPSVSRILAATRASKGARNSSSSEAATRSKARLTSCGHGRARLLWMRKERMSREKKWLTRVLLIGSPFKGEITSMSPW